MSNNTNTENTGAVQTPKSRLVWVYGDKQLSRGKPSKEVLQGRKRALVPVGETFTPGKHKYMEA